MKKWYQSKTFWFNALTIMLGIVKVVSDVYIIPADTLILINGIGNVILRFLTTKPIK